MMDAAPITLTLSRDEVAHIHRHVAGEALTFIGHAMKGTLRPHEVARKDWLVALSDKLADAQDAAR